MTQYVTQYVTQNWMINFARVTITLHFACDDEAKGGRKRPPFTSASPLGKSPLVGQSPLVTHFVTRFVTHFVTPFVTHFVTPFVTHFVTLYLTRSLASLVLCLG